MLGHLHGDLIRAGELQLYLGDTGKCGEIIAHSLADKPECALIGRSGNGDLEYGGDDADFRGNRLFGFRRKGIDGVDLALDVIGNLGLVNACDQFDIHRAEPFRGLRGDLVDSLCALDCLLDTHTDR